MAAKHSFRKRVFLVGRGWIKKDGFCIALFLFVPLALAPRAKQLLVRFFLVGVAFFGGGDCAIAFDKIVCLHSFNFEMFFIVLEKSAIPRKSKTEAKRRFNKS